jgi:hypothetical protein
MLFDAVQNAPMMNPQHRIHLPRLSNFGLVLTILLTVFSSAELSSQDPVAVDDFIISKGRAYGTLTFSLDHRVAENEDQLLRYVIDQDRLNYRIIGSGGYAIIDNLTLGLGVGYGRERQNLIYEDQDGQEITSNSLQQGMSIVPNMRTFIPIGKGKLQILVQTEVSLTFGESLERVQFADDVDKIEGNFFEGRLGVSPGALLFFDRHWAFEVTVGLAGLSTRIDEEVTNNDESNRTRVVQTGVDFQLNLLQLNLGVAYYY